MYAVWAFALCLSTTTIGTSRAQDCDPNYDPCVPVASDVDCAGGSGNGPAYVTGTLNVVGTRIYGLDRDGDSIACEPKQGNTMTPKDPAPWPSDWIAFGTAVLPWLSK